MKALFEPACKWLLSFRDQVCLLEPEEIRAELREQLRRMIKNYE